MKKQVMHRDMSHRNILVNPFGIADTSPEGPIFVNTILNSQSKAQPTALICDLDNGCVYGGVESSEEIKEQLKSRTVRVFMTAMYSLLTKDKGDADVYRACGGGGAAAS